MQVLDRTRPRLGSQEAPLRPTARPTMGPRSQSEPKQPTTRSASTAARPSYQRALTDHTRVALRSLTLSQIASRSSSNFMQPAPSDPQAGAENPTRKSPAEPPALPVSMEPKPIIPRSASMPVAGNKSKPRIPVPKPDVSTWVGGEVDERQQLSLRPVTGVRPMGQARVVDVAGHTLVLSALGRWDTPFEQRLVSQLLTTGLVPKATLVMRQDGLLRRINCRGLIVPLPDGLYTFGIDQAGRFLVSLSANPTSSAALSAQGRREDGALGSHGELVVHLPGRFFGEVEIKNHQAVAWNNRSSMYMTPAELSAQVRDHDVLSQAAFFPVLGGP